MSKKSTSYSKEYKEGFSAGFLLAQEISIWKIKINRLSPRDTLLIPLHENSAYITIRNLRSTCHYDVDLEYEQEYEMLYFNNEGIQYFRKFTEKEHDVVDLITNEFTKGKML